ncbi:MAG TPA: hypothetical protein VFA40_07895 [Terriglobales bacterium]|nr:hypothetical protein [Terriglobales bacterium]
MYELARRPDFVRLAIFLINLAVVLYMAFLRTQARERTNVAATAADSAD